MNCPMCHRPMDFWTIAKLVAKFGVTIAKLTSTQKTNKYKPPSFKPLDFNKCSVCGRTKDKFPTFKP